MASLYDEPCLLIGGAPRSGTTLLAQLIGRHSGAAILHEERLTDVVLAAERLASIRSPPEEAARNAIFGGARSFLSHPLSGDEGEIRRLFGLPSYRMRFRRLFRETFAVATGCEEASIVGSKLPIGHIWEDLDALAERLAALRIILIVRNPLDTISSSLLRAENARLGLDEWPIGDVFAAYAQWLYAVRVMAQLVLEPPAPVLVLKYEDLCARPTQEFGRISGFLGLAADDEILRAIRPLEDRGRRGLSCEDADFLRCEIGEVDAHWPSLTAQEALRRYAMSAPFIEPGRHMAFAERRWDPLLAHGFSFPEPWGRWTDGNVATLRFRHRATTRPARLSFDVALAWADPRLDGAAVQVSVNEGRPTPMLARAGRSLDIALSAVDMDREIVTISLHIPAPKRLQDAPVDDARRLGVGLAGLRLDLL